MSLEYVEQIKEKGVGESSGEGLKAVFALRLKIVAGTLYLAMSFFKNNRERNHSTALF